MNREEIAGALLFDINKEIGMVKRNGLLSCLENKDIKDLERLVEDRKERTHFYKKLARLLEKEPPELLKMIDSLADKLAFYLALAIRLNINLCASTKIIDALVSGELKPGKSEEERPMLRIVHRNL